jgi:SAM-dependent methyltransferase
MLPLAPQQPQRLDHAETPRPGTHWLEIARHWHQVGPPLRPSVQDIGICTAAVQRWAATHGAPRALILGVTPELYHLPWPAGTQLSAVDHTPSMIEAVWPGPRSAVLCANWTELPLDTASRDLVLCDGGLHLLSHPHAHQQLVRALRRIIAPGGLCIFRLFVPPVQREMPEAVLRDLLAGGIANLNILKLRLGMALQETSEGGVQLAQVWDALRQAAPDFSELAARLGWSLDHLLAIDTYRDCSSRYHFLGIADVDRLFTEQPGAFTFVSLKVPQYELGNRCPTIVFRRGGAIAD